MGLSYRKRIGGLNISASKKNGIGFSYSIKVAKNITLNLKPGRSMRTTVNLGNGIRWTTGGRKSTSSVSRKSIPAWKLKKLTRQEERNVEAYENRKINCFVEEYNDLIDKIEEINEAMRIIRNDSIDHTIKFRDNGVMCFDYVSENDSDINDLIAERGDIQEEFKQFATESNNKYYLSFNPISKIFGYKLGPSVRFAKLRDDIIATDQTIDYRRAIGWPEEELVFLKIRRNNYVQEMKQFVKNSTKEGQKAKREEEYRDSISYRHKPTVKHVLMGFSALLAVSLVTLQVLF